MRHRGDGSSHIQRAPAQTSPPPAPVDATPAVNLTCLTPAKTTTLSTAGVVTSATAAEHKNW